MNKILLVSLFLLLNISLFGQRRWYGSTEDFKLGLGYTNVERFGEQGLMGYLAYSRVFREPTVVSLQLTYSQLAERTNATFDLGLYYAVVKDFYNDLRIGGGLSARYFPITDIQTGEEDFELVPGLLLGGTYDFMIAKKWFIGANAFLQYYGTSDTALNAGIHLGRKL